MANDMNRNSIVFLSLFVFNDKSQTGKCQSFIAIVFKRSCAKSENLALLLSLIPSEWDKKKDLRHVALIYKILYID